MAGPASRVRGERIRPAYNVMSILDLMSGRFYKGKDGLWYLNGGYHQIMGFAGRANMFKSALAGTMTSIVSLRYTFEYTEFYDSEMTMNAGRIQDYIDTATMANYWEENKQLEDLMEDPTQTWNLVRANKQSGERWWHDNCRGELAGREKLTRKQQRETPFPDFDGSFIAVPNPWLFVVDSLSEFHTGSVERKFEKGTVGESDMNTEALDDARAKAQIMKQMPTVAARGNYLYALVAHADDEMKLDQYAPSQKKLADLKNGLKLKGVPGRQFSFLPNSILIATGLSNGLNKSDKMPEYPHPHSVPKVGDTDLRIVEFMELRGKGGPTGAIVEIVFSQHEGMLVGVTEYHFLKEHCGSFGMEQSGSGGAFRTLHLYPELTFTRKNLREHLNRDAKFARAMGITASLAYINANWFDLDPEYKLDAKTLYEKVKEHGYDWDEILSNTVDYWYFNDQAADIGKPTITVMTLIEMALGKLKPSCLKCSK